MKIAILLAAASLAAAQDNVIAGRLVTAESNAPLANALVVIAPTQLSAIRAQSKMGNQNRVVVTGTDGRFTFLNVAPGKYQLTASRPNDSPQAYLGNGQFSTAIVTGAGVDTASLVFPYHLPGSISGTVVDEKGEPVPQAHLTLFVRNAATGRVQVQALNQAGSSGKGAFHFNHLPAGEYFVGASARPWYTQSGFTPSGNGPAAENPNKELDVAYAFTYYPGATDFSEATPIKVTDGSTASIQIALRAVPALHVKVAGIASPPNTSLSGQLFAIGPSGQPVYGANSSMIHGDELTGMAPGRYLMSLQSFGQGKPMEHGTKSIQLSGDGTVDLSNASPISVSGTVTIEGTQKPTNPILVVLSQDGRPGASQMAGEDGHFEFQANAVNPGSYQVTLPNNPAFFIESVTAKGANYQGGQLELNEGATVQLAITIAPSGKNMIEGVAVRNDKPMAGAMVLLLPVNSSMEQLVRRDQSDLDGSFAMAGVPPGEYRILAIDDGTNLAYLDSAVMQPFLANAQRLTVGTAETPSLRVSVQTRKQ